MPLIFLSLVLLQQAAVPPAVDRTTQTGAATYVYENVKSYILKSAAKMPPEHVGFQPTPEVRSFGQVLAHIADANHLLCSPAAGVPSANGSTVDKIEQEKLAREPLIARLEASFEVCDAAHKQLTDANMSDMVPFMSSNRTRLALLWFHISHAFEHYGNLVTYMRLKNVVPPSSER
ncbi:MAG TPA: DinB family protein [Vicinamibacterales bacterium]|nr:DinB family protein [Vicinamibacterales bacterium]